MSYYLNIKGGYSLTSKTTMTEKPTVFKVGDYVQVKKSEQVNPDYRYRPFIVAEILDGTCKDNDNEKSFSVDRLELVIGSIQQRLKKLKEA